MAIKTLEEAREIAQLLEAGEITGAGAEAAYADLEAFDAQQQAAKTKKPAAAMMDAGIAPFSIEPEAAEKAARSAASGIREGLNLAVDGVRQLSASIKDSWNSLFSGKPYRVEEGPSKRGISPQTETYSVTQKALMRQQISQQEAQEAGVSMPIRGAMSEVTKLGLGIAVPEVGPFAAAKALGMAARPTTMIGGVMRDAYSNAAGSMIMFDTKNNQAADAMAAATLGVPLSVATGFAPASMNAIGRWLTRSKSQRTAKELEQVAREFPDVQFSLAQVAGIPEMTLLEQRAYNSKMVDFYATQSEKLTADIAQAFDQKIPGGLTPEKLTARTAAVASQADNVLRKIKGNAIQAWDEGIAEAARLEMGIQSTPSPVTKRPSETFVQGGVPDKVRPVQGPLPRQRLDMPAENLKAVAKKWLDNANDPVVGGVSKETRARLRAWNDLLNKNTTLSAQDVDRLWKGINGIKDDAPHIHLELRGALDSDFGVLAANGSSAQNKVAETLIETRRLYKTEMTKYDLLAKSTAYKLLGVGDNAADVNGTDLVESFLRMNPERQRDVRGYLQDNAPDMLRMLRQRAINDAVRRTTTVRAGADAIQDPAVLARTLFNPAEGFDLRTSGLWDAKDVSKLEAVKSALRVIENSRVNVGGKGTPLTPEDMAINFVARHAGFLARQAARVLMGTKAADLFSDPKMFEKLQVLNRTTINDPRNIAARVAILDSLQTDYAEDGKTQQAD